VRGGREGRREGGREGGVSFCDHGGVGLAAGKHVEREPASFGVAIRGNVAFVDEIDACVGMKEGGVGEMTR